MRRSHLLRFGRLLRRAGLAVALALLVLVGVLLVRTFALTSRQGPAPPAVRLPVIDAEAIDRLAGAIRFPTISPQDPAASDAEAFGHLHDYLRRSFPETFQRLSPEVVAGHSLLFTWWGTDTALAPIVLLAHLDVVPVAADLEERWTHPPFSGAIADGYVWGRGTLDDKVAVVGILEAVERLLKQGFQPRRTVLLAFGHDEEIGGRRGARALAALLRKRKIRPLCVLDEGSAIGQGLIPGLAAPVALVGIAEKGYLTVELSTEAAGGHSSMPPAQTAVGIIAAAVARLEQNPMPGSLDGVVGQTFAHLGPEMPFGLRMVFANLWLFGGLVERQLAARPATNAALRTTMAATLIEGGLKENILPTRARAVLNFRIRPGDRIATVLDHVRRTVADPRVAIRPLDRTLATEPSRVSSTKSESYELLRRTIRQVFPGALVAPSLAIAATDSAHYLDLGGDTYRFLPIVATADDLARIHGANERIGIEVYKNCVRFYIQWIRNAAS
ncbi:MAG: M20 family peptidase [Isosphaeraceae bacterium]|nr:M20 family peptidase [Isosphaeraceae bacterium]